MSVARRTAVVLFENLLNDLRTYPNIEVKGEVVGAGTIDGLELSFYDMRWNRSNGYVRGDKAIGKLTYEQLKFDKYEVDGFGLPKRAVITAKGMDFDIPGATDNLKYVPDDIRTLILQFFKADKGYTIDFTFDNSALNLAAFELTVEGMATINAVLNVENIRATMFAGMGMDGFRPENSDIMLPRFNNAAVKLTLTGGLKDLIAEYLVNFENEVQMLSGQLNEYGLGELAITVENFAQNPESLEIAMSVTKDFTLKELFGEIETMGGDPEKIKTFLVNDLNLVIK